MLKAGDKARYIRSGCSYENYSYKKIITKIDSLIFSIILWNWLVDNPGEKKENCKTIDTQGWESNCALCEYSLSCYHCPMYGKWPLKRKNATIENCSEGAYSLWHKETFTSKHDPSYSEYDIAFFALILVEAFEERLKEMFKISTY